MVSTEPKPLKPGDALQFQPKFKIEYHITEAAREKLQQMQDQGEDIFSQSLMEKAGLAKPRGQRDDDD